MAKKSKKQTQSSGAPKATRSKKDKSGEPAKDAVTTSEATDAGGANNRPAPAKPFSQPQLTALCFLSMGASRLFEWKRAMYEITEQTESHSNGTGICQEYMLTNEEVDYDSICKAPVVATLVTYKYHTSVQLVVMVFWIMIQVWQDEAYFAKLNTLLSLTPISTTLLLLQACVPWITKAKSQHLSITCAVLMVVAFSSSITIIRNLLTGNISTKGPPRGALQSVVLSAMVFLNGYELYQWYQTTVTHGSSGAALAESLLNGSNWSDALNPFLYSIMLDKFTMCCLLSFVWLGLPEGRQRRFLFVWAVVQGLVYQYQLAEYKAEDFADLETMKKAALACSAMAGIAWFAPSSATNNNNNNKQKVS